MLQKKKIRSLLLLSICLMAVGCGNKSQGLTDGREVYVKDQKEEKSKEEENTTQEEQLFIITGLNTEQSKIVLKGYKEQQEKEYDYTRATYIKDKYGNSIAMNQLEAGEMVNVALQKNTVKSIQVSDEIFTYADVHNFTVDTDAKTITVGKNSYYYDDDIQVFYHNNRISMAEISERDTLCLKGIDKKIYAIQVTSGHGTVVLQNTEMLEGGNITIGNILSVDIQKDMRIEVPEGTYLLSVANDGYGGNCEVTIEANRETTVNLEELKGEGPKYCSITFAVEPENAVLYLNGQQVDLSQPLTLKYGRYALTAKADGYADWQRTLVVNSESANLKIQLLTTEEEEEAEEAAAEATQSSTENTDQSGTQSSTTDSAKAQEEAVQQLIQQIRNGTLSTSQGSSTN